MSKNEVFLTAHSIARQTRGQFDTYRAALSHALRRVYAANHTGGKLEALGLHKYAERYYVGADDLGKVFNCSIDRYKTGRIRTATLNGKPLSKVEATCLFDDRNIFFDTVSKTWRQSYLLRTADLCDELKAALIV